MNAPLLRRAAGVLALALGLGAPAAQAGDYPERAIRIIVPYSPGGSSDVPMRAVAQEMARTLGQSVVIENRPGQGGLLGSENASRAAPDGYTLLLASNPQAIGATLYKNLGFDPVEDFSAISLFAREPGVLVVNPRLPVNTLAEFIEYVKARPGQVDFASSGNGSAQHLFMSMFLSAAGLDMMHVPYRGSAQAVTDVVAGMVPATLPGLSAMVPYVREGRLRALAVTGDHRSPLLPDVPTLAESGFPGFSAYVWSGLVAPKGTPPQIIDRLNRELRAAMASQPIRDFMDKASMEIVTDTPEEFQAFFREERLRSAKAIADAGIALN